MLIILEKIHAGPEMQYDLDPKQSVKSDPDTKKIISDIQLWLAV
jgi:hypothetical protein